MTTRSATASTTGGRPAPAPSPRGDRTTEALEPKWAAAIDRATD
jgi:hypothetical protein